MSIVSPLLVQAGQCVQGQRAGTGAGVLRHLTRTQ